MKGPEALRRYYEDWVEAFDELAGAEREIHPRSFNSRETR
jgi:hypothetical protein